MKVLSNASATFRNITSEIQKSPTKILIVATLLFFVPIFLIYYKESVSFNFIDEYNNFLAGYFLIKGYTLYSQIFFQHQPLMAYISYVLQIVLHPTTLYKLVMYHRLAIIFVSLAFDLLLVYRFRFVGLGFVIIFELSKFYLFGNVFLAESMVVYPLVYLLGLVWENLHKRTIAHWEIIFASLLTFFVVFMREPYIPTALILFAIVLIPKRPLKIKLISILLFLFLSAMVLLTLPIHDYLFELTSVNVTGVIAEEVQQSHIAGLGIVTIFIYPLLILTQGLMNYFRGVLVLIDLPFLIGIFFYSVSAKQWKKGLLLLAILGISNIRIEPPGTIFYGAYHMVVWYGLFIFMTLFLVKKMYETKQYMAIKTITSILLLLLLTYLLLPSNVLLWQKIDKQTVFAANYDKYYTTGEVVHNLANNKTTFFADGWDSLVYWQADVRDPYPYLFYYLPMTNYPLYTQARAVMFGDNPPEFVYSNCTLYKNKLMTYSFKEYARGNYEVFYFGHTPTCLYIKKSAIESLTQTQWKSIKQFGYYLKSKN
ncbi:MAG TPA: hypothetical protein VLF93_06515 [Candidatus Saccharimonadales bacterium]|nr:hypothetical protein [Candidatus Saccharimonadales bacterium]